MVRCYLTASQFILQKYKQSLNAHFPFLPNPISEINFYYHPGDRALSCLQLPRPPTQKTSLSLPRMYRSACQSSDSCFRSNYPVLDPGDKIPNKTRSLSCGAYTLVVKTITEWMSNKTAIQEKVKCSEEEHRDVVEGVEVGAEPRAPLPGYH